MRSPAIRLGLVTLVLVSLIGACAPAASPAQPKGAAGEAPRATSPTAAPAAAVAPTAAPAAAARPPATPDVVSVGWVRSINLGPFFVAQGRGYYTQEGLSVETAEFRSAADIVGALGTGQLDVNGGTVSAGTFNAWHRGVRMIVAAPTSEYPAEGLMPTNVVVRKELYDSGAVRTAADFRGRKLAVNVRGGINEYLAMQVLARRGLALADVELVTMPFPDMVPALANGSVEVITPPDPFGTQAIDQRIGVRLEEDQQSVGAIQPTHYLFSENFTFNRADVAMRFLAATMRAARELQGNWLADPTLAKIIEDDTGIKQEVLARAILPIFPPDHIVRVEDINAMQDAFLGLGHLSYSTPIDVTPFVNTALARQAKERLDARR